ncbi:MAG: MBL fold metallo-hydrolase, partial [Nitrospinota bacterium]|nr:MBL fold metallo-hydrolase [Nitrospinota bacterium]
NNLAADPAIQRHTLDTPYPVGAVHIYTTDIDGRLILFDTGPPTESAIRYHRENTDFDRLDYVFITHFHPDHIGLAKFFSENSNAKVVASRRDTFRYERSAETTAAMIRVFRHMGFPPQEITRSRKIIEWFEKSTPFTQDYLALEEQDELMARLGIRWMRCPGHSQSDIVYMLGNSAITGDILLREIFQTPLLDVDMETMNSRFCNYTAYCDTIPKLKSIESMRLHPSHREYVDSVDERITWYVGKLIDRATKAAPILLGGANIHDTVGKLFNGQALEPFTLYIKTSEIAFIRDFLDNPGRLIEALKGAGLYMKLAEKFAKLD